MLGSVSDGKVSLIAAVTKDLTSKLDAGKIVKQAAAYVEGSGGGRKDLAEAGGKNPAKLDEAIQAVPQLSKQCCRSRELKVEAVCCCVSLDTPLERSHRLSAERKNSAVRSRRVNAARMSAVCRSVSSARNRALISFAIFNLG